MKFDIDKARITYLEEAQENLDQLEELLLELENDLDNQDLLNSTFRIMHTIKGSGAMFGFDAITSFTHVVESVFDKVRSGKLASTEQLIVMTLEAHDVITNLLFDDEISDLSLHPVAMALKNSFLNFASDHEIADHSQQQYDETQNSMNAELKAELEKDKKKRTFRLIFKPDKDLFRNGTNPVYLLEDINDIGDCTISLHTETLPSLLDLDPEACYLYWEILLTTEKTSSDIQDIFIFVEDQIELKIDLIDEIDKKENVPEKKLGEILVKRGEIDEHSVNEILSEQKLLGDLLEQKGLVDSVSVNSALKEQEHFKKINQKVQQHKSSSSIRVDSEKLDRQMNLVGELLTIQDRLGQLANKRGDLDLILISEQVERLTGELRNSTMSVRMLPISTTFNRFKRLVHDLALELGLKARLETVGGETELDKTVLEQLNDPLVHLIRNSMDHGIEDPNTRVEMGKPEEGGITLSASYSGSDVLIKISDDGHGIEVGALKQKAIEKGLIRETDDISDHEAFDLMCEPGFSMKNKVSSLSGRGVGMDVVKQKVVGLRGSLEIDSEYLKGSVITLRLPLTLAIIDGLMLKIGNTHFVIPLNIIDECVELTRSEKEDHNSRESIDLRGQLAPYIDLRNLFQIEGEPPLIEQVVVTEILRQKVGFVVDSVVGEHQTVIKPLGKVYKNVEGLLGATILGDGNVALILDAPGIFKATLAQKNRSA
ncbi:MAG: chemotaxis protein CheA [Proteobacteria bacterium]|nr:chemotaxis protein CheA [Pseudomonadota bacterium]